MEEMRRKLEEHMKEDHAFHEAVAADIKTIKENHLAHIQNSMASMETNIGWLKWGVMLVLAGMVGLSLK